MKAYITLTLLSFLFFQISLQSNANQPSADNTIQLSIREHVDKLEKLKTIKLNGEKITGNETIIALYKENDYQPLWDNANNKTDLVEILESAYFDGLHPEDYHIEYIKSYVEANNVLKLKDEAASDLIMTNALLTYAHHMIQGKVNPTELDPNWNYSKKPLPDNVEFEVMQSLQNQTLKQGAKSIRPDISMYAQFRKLFAHYDSLHKEHGEIEQIQYPGKALRLGDSSAVVGELKRHLSHFDNTMNSSDDNVFDEDLEAALIQFQEFNKLEADGIAGKNTYDMLNLSITERLDILRVNMERCRWLDNDIPDEFLVVNIADYNLFIIRDKKVDYTCRVVVGREYHKTPVFTSDIKYLVFNPTWTVPYSIATKETLPKLKADPQYLSKHNMTLLQGSKVVDPATVDFNKYSRKNFPFTVRQEPGPNNALGQVKFIFPNKYSVYLHDTPSKSFFQKSKRAFSHGCVRVHNPLVLAEQLLSKQGYDEEKIHKIVNSKKLQNVYLDKPMPVALMYWTCVENLENGEMYFRKDVYGRDKVILSNLNEKR